MIEVIEVNNYHKEVKYYDECNKCGSKYTFHKGDLHKQPGYGMQQDRENHGTTTYYAYGFTCSNCGSVVVTHCSKDGIDTNKLNVYENVDGN